MTDTAEIAHVQHNGWAVRFMRVGDHSAAYAAVKGSEVHFKVLAGKHREAMQRDRLRAFAQALLDEFVFLTTRVEVEDEANQRFVRFMGFTDTWSDATYKYFLMTALPFERN